MNHEERIDKIITAGANAVNTITGYTSALRHFWTWAWITKQIESKYPIPTELIESYILEHIEGFNPGLHNK